MHSWVVDLRFGRLLGVARVSPPDFMGRVRADLAGCRTLWFPRELRRTGDFVLDQVGAPDDR